MKFILILAIILSAACQPKNQLLDGEKKVHEIISDSKGELLLKLDTVIAANWNTAILITPYWPLSSIEEKYQIDLSCVSGGIESYDDFVTIGFLQNSACVGYIEIRRSKEIELLDKPNAEPVPIKREDFTLRIY